MVIFLIKNLRYLQNNSISTEELVAKISDISDIDSFSLDILKRLHRPYYEDCLRINRNLDFTVPGDGLDNTLSAKFISEILFKCKEDFLHCPINVFSADEDIPQLLNQVLLVCLNHPLETFAFMIPFFAYHSVDSYQLAVLHSLIELEPKLLISLVKDIFDIEYNRFDIDDLDDLDDLTSYPSWVVEDTHNIVNWHYVSDNLEEAIQDYSNSIIRLLVENKVTVNFSSNVPELDIPNEVASRNPDSEITSSFLEERDNPQIDLPSELRESNSLVVRNNFPR